MSIILYTNSISDESATEEKIKVATTYTTTYIEQLLEKSVKMLLKISIDDQNGF